MKRIVFYILAALALGTAMAHGKGKHPNGKQYIWRYTLADKQGTPYSLDHPTRWLSRKSVERRRRQGLSLDSTDLPVSSVYLRTMKQTAAGHHTTAQFVGTSRWNNTVLVRSADTTLLGELSRLAFVREACQVWATPDSAGPRMLKVKVHEQWNPWDSLPGEHYGHGKQQIEMLHGQRLHNIHLRGQGMTIAVLDGGFQNVDKIPALQRVRIDGVRDFVSPPSPLFYAETDHGTKVLSAMAADVPEVLIGTAPEAHYWLLRCEDQQSEQLVEEDYWAMAAEFADSIGADLINSSLGYNEFDDSQQNHRLRDLDGQSTLISRTASMLARKGIVLVNSAGNTGMSPWKKLCVPADAHEILTVGALNSQMKVAPFTSVGPTQDGRVKPDVMAQGSPAALINGRGSIMRDMGTSFATPIVCGLVACLWQSMPQKSALDIINLVRKTSDNYQTPDNIYGYGTPNFWRAYMTGQLELRNEE